MALITSRWQDTFDRVDPKEWWTSVHSQDGSSWIDTAWSANNVQTNNGELRLELNTQNSRTKDYTGGEITSHDTFGYGRYEVTMKSSGEEGVASTFFTYTGREHGTKWNEIDFELVGGDRNRIHIAYHNEGKSYARDIPVGFDHSAGFHKYAFEWEPGEIRWYADGKLLHEVESSAVPNTPSKLILNIWTGLEQWLGDADFSGETAALYRDVSFTPYVPGQGYGGGQSTPAPSTGTGSVGAPTVVLADARSDQALETLSDGETVPSGELGSGELTLLATPTGSGADRVQSVTIALNGPGDADFTRTENSAPYALFGDEGGDNYAGRVLPRGDYTATITSWSGDNASGSRLNTHTVDFTLGASSSSGGETAALKIQLVEGGSGRVLDTISDGERIDLDRFDADSFSFEAVPPGGTQSVKFDLDGPVDTVRTENTSAYLAFGGDENPTGRDLRTGTYSLDADAFSSDNGGGRLVASADLDFTFI